MFLRRFYTIMHTSHYTRYLCTILRVSILHHLQLHYLQSCYMHHTPICEKFLCIILAEGKEKVLSFKAVHIVDFFYGKDCSPYRDYTLTVEPIPQTNKIKREVRVKLECLCLTYPIYETKQWILSDSALPLCQLLLARTKQISNAQRCLI